MEEKKRKYSKQVESNKGYLKNVPKKRSNESHSLPQIITIASSAANFDLHISGSFQLSSYSQKFSYIFHFFLFYQRAFTCLTDPWNDIPSTFPFLWTSPLVFLINFSSLIPLAYVADTGNGFSVYYLALKDMGHLRSWV